MKTATVLLCVVVSVVFAGDCNEYCSHPVEEGTCCQRLGLNLYRNADVVISASSSYNNDHGPQRSGLFETTQGGVASWSAQANNVNQWIQADFGSPRKVTGVLLQGRGECCDQWVTSFRMMFSNDGEVFYSTAPIDGTFDRDTVARRYFDKPITARYFRLSVISWNNHISLRWDLLGCKPMPVNSSDSQLTE